LVREFSFLRTTGLPASAVLIVALCQPTQSRDLRAGARPARTKRLLCSGPVQTDASGSALPIGTTGCARCATDPGYYPGRKTPDIVKAAVSVIT